MGEPEIPEEVRRAAADPKNRFGKYVAVRPLGQGASGIVHKAWDGDLRRWTALKLLTGLVGDEDLARFRREAETAASLRHPGIVTVYEVGEAGSRPFIAMEFVDGRTLAGRSFPPPEAARLMIETARAVAHAHRHRIIHRDLKPQNVMLDPAGHIRVMDFGLARRLRGDPRLTLSGTIMGTPSYMSPEQAQGLTHLVDARSDLFSLGAMLYELLTGQPPFRGATPLETLSQVVDRDVVPPSRHVPAIPPDLERIVLKALEKKKERRYPSAEAFAQDLERFARGERVAAPSRLRARWALLIAVPVLALAASSLLLLRSPEPAPPRFAPPALPSAAPAKEGAAPRPPRAKAQPEIEAGLHLLDQVRLDRYRPNADLTRHKSSLEEAIRRFTRALELCPDHEEAALGRARARTMLHRRAEAEKDFDLAVELSPSSPAARLARGRHFLARILDASDPSGPGFHDLPEEFAAWRRRALDDFRKTRELGLRGPDGAFLDASLAYAEGDPAKARDVMTKLLKEGSKDEEHLKLRADATHAFARTLPPSQHDALVREAESDYTEALKLRPHYFEALRARAGLRFLQGRGPDSRADFEAGLALAPEDSVAHSDLATWHQRSGDATAAFGEFGRAIALDASNFRAWANRGALRMSQKDFPGGEKDLREALKISPGYVTAKFNLSVCRAEQSDVPGAFTLLDEILSRHPAQADALFARGSLHYRSSAWKPALADFLKAAEAAPRLTERTRPLIDECRRRLGSP